MVKKDIEVFYWLQRSLDFFIPFATVYVVFFLFTPNHSVTSSEVDLGAILGFLFVFISQLLGLYRATDLWYQEGFEKLIIKSWIVTVLFQFLLIDRAEFDSKLYFSVILIIPLFLWLYRYLIFQAFKKFHSRKYQRRKVAVLGAGKVGRLIASNIQKSLFYSVEIVGFFDDDSSLIGQQFNSVMVHSNLDDIASKLNDMECNEVFICLPVSSEKRIREVLDSLANSSIVVKFVPNLFSFDLLHADWHDLFGMPVLSVYDTPLNSVTNRLIKRTEDVLLSLLALFLSVPFMLVIAVLVKLTSRGPVLFKQVRYGLNGKSIVVYKFRTMYVDSGQNHTIQASRNDARVTPLGHSLRRSSLDELPQFFNVLLGDMSIVGPRPHASEHNEFYRGLVPKYMQRHMVKPGITGLAQVNGFRGRTETIDKMEKRVEYDLHYIRTWSLWLDLKIFLLTLIKGFFHKNAY